MCKAKSDFMGSHAEIIDRIPLTELDFKKD